MGAIECREQEGEIREFNDESKRFKCWGNRKEDMRRDQGGSNINNNATSMAITVGSIKTIVGESNFRIRDIRREPCFHYS